MAVRSIDRLRVRELHDQGKSVSDIAKEMGCGKGAISKILKTMGLCIVKSAAEEAPRYVEKKNIALENLNYLMDKAKQELEWIEDTVPSKNDAEYRAWQDQKLKFCAELRKLIAAIGDIGFKLFHAQSMSEVIEEILDEIAEESPDCRRRILARIDRRRKMRCPGLYPDPTGGTVRGGRAPVQGIEGKAQFR